MRLVLVHGINQQAKSSASIELEWLTTLRAAAGNGADWPQNRLTRVDTPFYGDRLFALTETPDAPQAIAQGTGEVADDFTDFAAAALTDMALALGATRDDIEQAAQRTTVPQGAGIHQLWVKATARVIEKISPAHGALALRLLGQAHAYLKRPHVALEVDAIVRPALAVDDEPAIIVAHSLGTIVTYKLLREMAAAGQARAVPLLVTLGSPLGIDVVRRSFTPPRGRPAGVARWVNGADPEDFVALRSELNEQTFGTGIENISDIANDDADPHRIAGPLSYLAEPRIAATIAVAIAAAIGA